MTKIIHIQNNPELPAGEPDYYHCLCGYHATATEPYESIHTYWLIDAETPRAMYSELAPNCEACIERSPLALLADMELE